MLRTLADMFYNKDYAIQWLKSKSPSEEIVFASAATILETEKASPVSWSLKRLFQHRGVVMITQNQLALKDGLVSVSTVFFLFFFIVSFIGFLQSQDWNSVFAIIVFGGLILQRFPYQQQIPLKDIQKVEVSEISGITGKYSLLTIYLKNKAINIVPVQILKKEIVELISTQIK
jgi:hypothetical protein